jgi:hypothetical protein
MYYVTKKSAVYFMAAPPGAIIHDRERGDLFSRKKWAEKEPGRRRVAPPAAGQVLGAFKAAMV